MNFEGIEIDVKYKDIRSLRLTIRRDGSPALSVPFGLSNERVLIFLEKNKDWLKRKRAEVITRQKNEEALYKHQYDEGEVFTYLGKEYPLHLISNGTRTEVVLESNGIYLYAAKPLKPQQRMAAINAWYMLELQQLITELTHKWLHTMNEKPVREIRFRKMKSQWGSCAPIRRILCFNTRLIFKPKECVEEVVVHELCHLKEASHNARFHALMAHYLPDYRERNEKLKHTNEGLIP